MTDQTNPQSKRECSLLRRAARNNDARRSQEAILKPITSPGLANDRFFGGLARLMGDRFVLVRIKLFAFVFDLLQSVLLKQFVQLFLNENHSGINRRLFALRFCGRQTKLKIVEN